MGRYWKCPSCGAVLDKGEDHASKAATYLSPSGETIGTTKCGECGSACNPRDVYSGKYDVADPPVASGPDDITCANCRKMFPWPEAYNQRDTPGSYAYNPPGHGDFRPRAFCPHCGFLVAEWDIDRRADRDQWRWYGPNAEANQDKPFPPDPDSLWGRGVPTSARSITEEESLDLPRVRDLLEESERDRERREKEKARQLAPDDLDGHCRRGFLHLEDNELDDAIADFNGCLERRIDHAPAHRGLGWACYLASRGGEPAATIDMALSHLREAIRLDPGDGEAHFFLGIIHHDENREADAVSEWEKALELGLPQEKEAAARSNLGQAYVARGQLAEAVAEFERAEALDPSVFAPHAYLWIIYDAWGEDERAEEERRQAERTCGGASLTPSVRVGVRGLASSTPRSSVVAPIHPKARGARLICPKCQAENAPDQTSCDQCGASLLPTRGVLGRIGYFVGSVVGAAIFVGLAMLFARWEDAPPCCASPVTLGLFALSCLVGGLRFTFGRTPEYERYVERAQRHIEAFPEQALADFARALELAPEKQQADILRQRGELYAKLGRKAEALADLSAYAASPHAHKGAKVLSEIVGVDLEEAAGGPTERAIDELRNDLVREGALEAVGYCKHCKDAVTLDENRACSRCGVEVKEPRFVKPEDTEAELAKLHEEAAGRQKRRRTGRVVGGIALFLFVLCAGMGGWYSLTQKTAEKRTPTVVVTPTPTTVGEIIFAYEHPADWEAITEDDISTLLRTSLKGLKPGSYDYIGGFYTGGVDDCGGCARIVVVVVRNPSLTGTLTDAEYKRVKENTEKEMGSRLISHRKVEVCSMPAAESVHIGKSGQTKIWEMIIVPPEPGVAYMFSCSSDKDSYDEFEDVFEKAIASLSIEVPTRARPAPTVGPAMTPPPPPTRPPMPTVRPTPSPEVISYAVRAGDTLAKIATRFGVTLEQIVEANDIEDPNLIEVGQVLIIPGR